MEEAVSCNGQVALEGFSLYLLTPIFTLLNTPLWCGVPSHKDPPTNLKCSYIFKIIVVMRHLCCYVCKP